MEEPAARGVDTGGTDSLGVDPGATVVVADVDLEDVGIGGSAGGVAVPAPTDSEVLIRVVAAGINNTDINTRTAWYSKSVSEATNEGGTVGFDQAGDDDATWSGVPMVFPRIQGADVCGFIHAVGTDVDPARIGERVLVRNMLRSYVDYRPYECWTLGSECDGGFQSFQHQFTCTCRVQLAPTGCYTGYASGSSFD